MIEVRVVSEKDNVRVSINEIEGATSDIIEEVAYIAGTVLANAVLNAGIETLPLVVQLFSDTAGDAILQSLDRHGVDVSNLEVNLGFDK